MEKNRALKILTIEDEMHIRQGIAGYLEDCGHTVYQAENGEVGVKKFRELSPDVVLTDLRMPVMGGREVLKIIYGESPETPVIIVSGTGDILDAVQAMRNGAHDYILKPVQDMEILHHSIERAIDYSDLLRQNRIYRENLEDAMRVARQDMAMAVNVQKNYFMKTAPDTESWDIAFEHRAMAGVSGDFYDFYERNGKLTGVALFDVSGHGIASGLITMLARSIIYRNFNSLSYLPLNNVMEKINSDLIQEIESVDNYLTGCLLRFDGDRAEYVNAAHPHILLKRTNRPEVEQVGKDDIQKNGSFLGTSVLAGSFGLHEFKIGKGDIILIYSDCLIDSFIGSGERFGINRVASLLEEQPRNLSAAAMLKSLLEKFYSATDKNILSDDLTVILMKKL
jgi:sigma-B regulation protein RsbU (phosphoserine phosphatase)